MRRPGSHGVSHPTVETTYDVVTSSYLFVTDQRDPVADRRWLHVRIIRSSSALGRHPVDVLPRVLDVARLAVDAVLRVDLQALRRCARLFVGDELVHAGGAVALLGAVVDREVQAHRE